MLQLLATGSGGINCDNFPPACITDLSKLSNVLLPLVYIGAALMLLGLFIYAAFLYIQSSGDPTAVKEAQQTMSYAVLGIIVIIVAYVLVRLIAYIVDIPFLL
jgi:hypothetical protein